MKLFALQMANNFQFLSYPDIQVAIKLHCVINREPLLADWKTPVAYFMNVENKSEKKPSMNLFGGSLMFAARFKQAIFPKESEDIEFLPISVSEEPWLIANCLRTTRHYDPSKSIVYRSGENKEIFMVAHMVVNDASLEQCEMFTIDDSNRTQIFVQPSFVERIKALGLKGVNFKEIGTLNAA
jgi:hypothetical protein